MSGQQILLKKPNGHFTNAICDDSGNLKCELTSSIDVAIGDVEMKGTENVDGSGAKRHIVVDSTGHQSVNVLGNEEADGSGAVRHLHLDGNGNLHTNVTNTVIYNPANVANSEVTDDPTSSMCVTLKGRTAINDKTAGKHIKITPNGRLEPVLHARTNIADAATETAVLCDSAGHLQVDVPATVGIKLEDLSSTIDADHVNNSRSLPTTMKARSTIGDHTTGTYLLCDANGHLAVEDKMLTVEAPTVNVADTTAIQRVNLSLHDSGNSTTRVARCDAIGRLITVNDSIHGGDDASLTTAQQNLIYGRAGAASLKALAVDTDGHLQVDIVSGGGGGGDATAANQVTGNTTLSAISGKLPAVLGQAVKSASLSTCRDSTVGSYDLSARQTISTASSSTKLRCTSAGHIFAKTALNTSNGGPSNTATIASGALGHTEGLSADNTFCNVYLMIDTTDSGVLQDTYVMVARQNTATEDYFLHTKIHSAPTDPAELGWVQLPGTTRYYAHVHIRKPPEFVGVYNGGPSANKIAVLFNYGVE